MTRNPSHEGSTRNQECAASASMDRSASPIRYPKRSIVESKSTFFRMHHGTRQKWAWAWRSS